MRRDRQTDRHQTVALRLPLWTRPALASLAILAHWGTCPVDSLHFFSALSSVQSPTAAVRGCLFKHGVFWNSSCSVVPVQCPLIPNPDDASWHMTASYPRSHYNVGRHCRLVCFRRGQLVCHVTTGCSHHPTRVSP